MEWGMSTNFDGVFDLILEQAVQAELPREQMIQQVVCYSDMEFNVSRPALFTNGPVTATDGQQPRVASARSWSSHSWKCSLASMYPGLPICLTLMLAQLPVFGA